MATQTLHVKFRQVAAMLEDNLRAPAPPPSAHLAPGFCHKIHRKIFRQGGHCPGNQGNYAKVRESRKGLKWSGCPNVRVLPFLRFNLMISVSTKMPYQEVREISLRSGKVRKNESRKKSGLKVEKSGHPVRFLKLIPQNHLIGMT